MRPGLSRRQWKADLELATANHYIRGNVAALVQRPEITAYL